MSDTDTYEPTASTAGTHFAELCGRYYEGASAPSDPETSDMWYDTDTDTIYYYTGSGWVGADLS